MVMIMMTILRKKREEQLSGHGKEYKVRRRSEQVKK